MLVIEDDGIGFSTDAAVSKVQKSSAREKSRAKPVSSNLFIAHCLFVVEGGFAFGRPKR